MSPNKRAQKLRDIDYWIDIAYLLGTVFKFIAHWHILHLLASGVAILGIALASCDLGVGGAGREGTAFLAHTQAVHKAQKGQSPSREARGRGRANGVSREPIAEWASANRECELSANMGRGAFTVRGKQCTRRIANSIPTTEYCNLYQHNRRTWKYEYLRAE